MANSTPKIIGLIGPIGGGKNYIMNVIKEAVGNGELIEIAFAKQLKLQVMEKLGLLEDSVIDYINKKYISQSDLAPITKDNFILRWQEYDGYLKKEPDISKIIKLDTLSNEGIELLTKLNYYDKNSYLKLFTYRQALQDVGSYYRDNVDIDYWVKLSMKEIDERFSKGETSPFYIITDARYENELQAIRKRGGISARILVPREVQIKNIMNRDGIAGVNNLDNQEKHISEQMQQTMPFNMAEIHLPNIPHSGDELEPDTRILWMNVFSKLHQNWDEIKSVLKERGEAKLKFMQDVFKISGFNGNFWNQYMLPNFIDIEDKDLRQLIYKKGVTTEMFTGVLKSSLKYMMKGDITDMLQKQGYIKGNVKNNMKDSVKNNKIKQGLKG